MTNEEWRELFKKHVHSPRMDEDEPNKIDIDIVMFVRIFVRYSQWAILRFLPSERMCKL